MTGEETGMRQPAIRVTMMPRDTNYHGTIFGGVLLSYIDQAGAVEAVYHVHKPVVTVAMREVVFHEPVMVGDVVSFYASITKAGRTSLTVQVEVFSTRLISESEHRVQVTEAEVVYVSVGPDGAPVPHGLTIPSESNKGPSL